MTATPSNVPEDKSVAWPTDCAPSRARFDGFGDFIAARTEHMVKACQARQLPILLTHAVERCADHYWLRSPRLMRLRRVRSNRRKRTERRCAHVLVLQFLLAHVDLVTLQCVVGGSQGLRPPSVDEIAARTGLSLGRVEGVISELAHVGYLRTKRRHAVVEQSDGSTTIVNQVAVRWLTPTLFEDLGLLARLTVERRRAMKRRRAAQVHATAPAARAGQGSVGRSRPGPLGFGPGRRRQAQPIGASAAQIAVVRLASSMKAEHLDWDRERCYAEARRRLGDPPNA